MIPQYLVTTSTGRERVVSADSPIEAAIESNWVGTLQVFSLQYAGQYKIRRDVEIIEAPPPIPAVTKPDRPSAMEPKPAPTPKYPPNLDLKGILGQTTRFGLDASPLGNPTASKGNSK